MHRLVNSVVLLSLALVGGCATDDYAGGIFVRQAVAPGTGCTLMAIATEPGITHGELSSVYPTSYIITAQMESRITAPAGEEAQRTILVTGANVDLTFPGSTLFTTAELADMKTKSVTHFKSLFSAPIAPNAGITDAGFQITTPALYNAIYAKAAEAAVLDGPMPFALEVVATFTIEGMMAGNSVNSQPFQFPISIANNNGVVSSIAPTCPVPSTAMIDKGNNCHQVQDASTTCCQPANNGPLICPATIATTMTP